MSFGYLFGILLDIIWISLDIFMDTVKISQAYPLISSQYPELSIYLSRDIHLLIQRYPSTYPEISICLSIYIHLLIQSDPFTYPELSIYLSKAIHLPIQRYPAGYLIRFWLVLLAAACSCCDSSCIAFTQATTGRCLHSRPGDGAAGQVGARRRGVTTPGPAAATTPGP